MCIRDSDWVIPSDVSDIISLNYAENSITIIIPDADIQNAQYVVCGLSYTRKAGAPLPSAGDDDDDDDDEEAIPSFDIWILFGIVAFISLIAILKRKKHVKTT